MSFKLRELLQKGIITHDRQVKSAVFSPDGTHVVTASYDKAAKIWDLNPGLRERKKTMQLKASNLKED